MITPASATSMRMRKTSTFRDFSNIAQVLIIRMASVRLESESQSARLQRGESLTHRTTTSPLNIQSQIVFLQTSAGMSMTSVIRLLITTQIVK